ncbi:GtrA family protein [Marinomonas sp. A79]|uniref:GtrA family protein n=1 Tax=Marinomonas vulgaris TaxID=2823372 RepID=A0ABS5HDD9_9GAMM|nr:GtrA family protein [Marinomonas vulgaris]MBR7889658.1 GtrA family protein [Marinomonas vulgaris]
MTRFFDQAFMRFALVGASGFVVDVACMLLFSLWLPFAVARCLAFWIAATSNWWLNRNITFAAGRNKSQFKQAAVRQWLKFLGGSVVAFVPNWGCYVVLLSFHDSVTHHTLHVLWPYLAMAPGVILGMLINYAFSRFWVFVHVKS